MNIDLLNMYSKIAVTLGVSGEQYSDNGVIWNIQYDDEYCIRIILLNDDGRVKLLVEHGRFHYKMETINQKQHAINSIIEYAKISGIS